MKNKIFALLALTIIGLSSCQKDGIEPTATPTTQVTPKVVASTTALNQDTVSNDTTKGYLRIQLAKDATNFDNILIDFNPSAHAAFVRSEDAPFMSGMGAESLSSLSSDNVSLAINQLPLVTKGTTVALVVNAKTTGIYNLNMVTISSIPANINIWLKDNYKKDSLDFRLYPTYAFNLDKADTNSFGSHRFTVVMRKK
jgi:hypothetical protein